MGYEDTVISEKLILPELEIIRSYLDGNSTTKLSKKYKVLDSKIYYILKKNLINIRKNKLIDKKIVSKIITMYKDGYSSTKLAAMFEVSNKTIFNILRKGGVKSRSIKDFSRDFKKYRFDLSFFTTESPQLAYFYGFCLGDGSLANDSGGKSLRITLNKKDKETLKLFLQWIKGDPGMIKDRKNVSTLRIQHSFLRKNQNKWGLVENKTYNPVIPKISVKLLPYFLTGLIDADGTVKFSKSYKINLVGNKYIMKWFINSIKRLGFNGKISVYDDDKNSVWNRIHINRKSDVLELSKILKIGYCDFIMNRKWKDIKKALNEIK